MNSSTIYLIIAIFIGLCGLGLFLFNRFFKRREDIDLKKAIEEAGYDYDAKQKIFYSRMDAWQRKYGYSKLYDDASVPLSMIFDCEPVHFEYGGKRWLIEFWKGQYGITTGCEIGVYTAKITDAQEDVLPGYEFYNSAGDEDLLPMTLVLRKNGKVLFRRSAVHWWLTGFILGEFSDPSELTMDVAVTLKTKDMLYAFARKLLEIGYAVGEIRVYGNTAIFTFSKPHSDQPRLHAKTLSRFSQWRNKYFCGEYRKIAGNHDNIYDVAKALNQKSPMLYNMIFNMGKPDKLFGKSILRR